MKSLPVTQECRKYQRSISGRDLSYFYSLHNSCTDRPDQLPHFLGYLVQIFISFLKLVSDEISIPNPVRETIFDRCAPVAVILILFLLDKPIKTEQTRGVCARYPLIKSLSDLIIKTTDVTHYVTTD